MFKNDCILLLQSDIMCADTNTCAKRAPQQSEVLPMRILFTGFEPFGGENVNPAWEAVERLPDQIGTAQIIKRRLPVEFQSVGRLMQAELDGIRPDVVICVGQAGGRSGISIERVAINLDDTTAPDNTGYAPVDQPIRRGAPAAYFSTLPIKVLIRALSDAGIPAHISNSAGTYVCNHLMYSVLDYFSVRMMDNRAGFIHVPYMTSQCADKPDTPCMELDEIVRALDVVVRALN